MNREELIEHKKKINKINEEKKVSEYKDNYNKEQIIKDLKY